MELPNDGQVDRNLEVHGAVGMEHLWDPAPSAAILQFVSAYNETCGPFAWQATAESILEKISRLYECISGTEQ